VLGLLASEDRSGYDMLKSIERGVGFFWSPAKSQLYGLLPTLVERGLAEVRSVSQQRRPDKQVYRITAAGRAALRDGLEQDFGGVTRNPFQLKLYFAGHMRAAAARELIEQRREEALAHLARLEELEPGVDRDADFFPYLTLLAGIENQHATIRWADTALRLLAAREKRGSP
jgi:DNA-binding PadR family transcriptional regulator